MKKQLFLLIGIVWLASCGRSLDYRTTDGFAQGTTYRITYADPAGRDLSDTITNFLTEFEQSLSIYDSLSLISRLNDNRTQVADAWFCAAFEQYKLVYDQSGGLLDPTLRPLIAIYGFGGKHSAPRSPSQAEIDSIMVFVGLDKVRLRGDTLVKDDRRIELDFNALAKGYSVDLMAAIFECLGIENYMVEIGGEIFARGVNAKGGAWRIGIDAPKEGNNTPGADLQTVVELSGRGLATSGNYRKGAIDQNGVRVTHTIDPRSGRPSHHNLLSATIIAPTTALADGYATSAMVGGLEWTKAFLHQHKELDAVLIYTVDETDPNAPFAVYSTL